METNHKNSKVIQLINSMGILVLSNIVLKAASFFLLPLYTKYLTPDQLGISDSITSISSFAFPILVFAFDSAFSAFYYDKESEEYQEKVFNTVLFFVLGSSLIAIILAIFSKPIAIGILGSADYSLALAISLVSVSLNMWYLPFSLVLRIRNRMLTFSIISMVSSLLLILLNIYFVAILKIGFMALILSTAIVNLIQIILYGYFSKANINLKSFSKPLFLKMFRYALPMLPTTISNWILNLSDRYILLIYRGEGEVGLYGIAFRFNNVINVITNAVLTAYTTFAFASKNDANAKEQYSKILNAVFYILSLICFAVALFSREIVMLMTVESYHSSYKLVGPLLYGKLYYTISSIFGYGFAYAKKSKNFIYPSALAMVLNVVLNIVFIPQYGAYAASLTTLLGFFVMMIVTYIMAQKVYPCHYDILKVLFISLLMIFIFTYFGVAHFLFKILILFLMFGLSSLVFKDTIKDLVKLLMQRFKRV